MRTRMAVLAPALALFLLSVYLLLPSARPAAAAPPLDVPAALLSGGAIMPHLGNETLKSAAPARVLLVLR